MEISLKKYKLLDLFGVLEVNLQFLAVMRQGFLEKSEEVDPPLKWPILGGSTFFTFSQKCLITELEPSQV